VGPPKTPGGFPTGFENPKKRVKKPPEKKGTGVILSPSSN